MMVREMRMAIVRQRLCTWDAQGASLVMVWEVEVVTRKEILHLGCSDCQSRDGFEDENGEIYRDVAPWMPRTPVS